jgi:hypothetical protein
MNTKSRLALSGLCLILALSPTAAATIRSPFDVNEDGFVTIVDLQHVVTAVLGKADSALGRSDVNDDAVTNIRDVFAVVDVILGGDDQRPKVLGENGLTQEDREQWYRLPEGSELYPLEWYRRLKDSETGRPFAENLERFGLIVDPEYPGPYNLPIGISVVKPVGISMPMLGLSCSVCHTADFVYDDKRYRVDGAPNQFDIRLFFKLGSSTLAATESPQELLRLFGMLPPAGEKRAGGEILEGVLATIVDEERRAHELGVTPATSATKQEDEFLVEFRDNVRLLFARIGFLFSFQGNETASTPTQFGRLDAFGAARNVLYGKDYGFEPTTAPISFPHLWGTQDLAWLHWTSNTNTVLERNIGQAVGVGGVVEPKEFLSSVLVENLHELELLSGKIEKPEWPPIFPPINTSLAQQGQALYDTHCADCHDGGTVLSNGLLEVPILPLDQIGTDPNAIMNWQAPVGDRTFQEAIADSMGGIKEAYYERNNVPEEVQEEWEAGRTPVVWRNAYTESGVEKGSYSARPLAGIWAAAPYLHNNSVPTLYDLLLPPAQRPKEFPIGHREYDPMKLGFRQDVELDNANFFTTESDGNGNGGHTYGTGLDHDQRLALLEYIKTL